MWISSIQNLISRKFTFKKSLCDFSVQREFHQTNQELKGFLKEILSELKLLIAIN